MEQRDFTRNFELVYDKFIEHLACQKKIPSLAEFGRFLGHGHDGKVRAWKKGQWPSAEDCWMLEKLLGFNLRWLVTGEGYPFDSPATPAPAPPPAAPSAPPAPPPAPPQPQSPPPMPLIGFAACSILGWEGTMTIPVSVEPPTWSEGMIAVMASGESMLPAGIGHGHICYCDGARTPGIGDLVYVETTDNRGTIKFFCGWSERGGERYLQLQGWQDKQPGAALQKPLNLDIIECDIRRIAPIIYVRRRL